MAEAQTKPYTAYYTDGAYLTYDLTTKDVELVKAAMLDKRPADVSIGMLATADIRAFFVLKPKEVEQHKGSDPDLTEEAKAWVKQAEKADEYLDNEEVIDDDDFKGGMLV